jgi:NAD(P)H dehydrogenase (quinone)
MGRTAEDAGIAVIGAAGQTGSAVVRALARRGCRPTALIHGEGRAEAALGAGAGATRVCELEDRASVERSLEGLRTVHLIPPVFRADEPRLVANVRDAATAAGVRRVVLHSVLHPNTPSMPHHMNKMRAEAELRDSDLEWTILQPAMYAQTVLAYHRRSPAGRLQAPFDVRRTFTVVDLADVAEIAAAVLLDEVGRYGVYELAGPEALTVEQMAARIGALLGEDVVAEHIVPWRLAMPEKITRRMAYMAAMCDEYDRRGLVGNADVARMLLGREPTSFAAAAERELRERSAVPCLP